MKQLLSHTLLAGISIFTLLACQDAGGQPKKDKPMATQTKSSTSFIAGKDYTEYKWARLWDKQGFNQPVEAFSLLLPDGWKHEGAIVWNAPGTTCAGTNAWFKAQSADGRYRLDMLPNALWSWTTNPQMQQFYQNAPATSCQQFRQPVDAKTYLQQVWAPELGNPKIIELSPNQPVVDLMKQRNEEGRQELMRYGAAQVQFHQSAVTATVQWSDGKEAIVLCGVSIVETIVPNTYTGTYDTQYTTSFVNQTVFRYPAGERALAKNQLSAILASVRTNPTWKNSLDQFWKDVRQKKHVEHVGRIALMDQQTAAIGRETIRKGNERLGQMDADMRSWEARQSSQDRMHTNFIKTIREVENYRDESGKVELSSGYNHAWSRNDGNSFILTDNPNFNPSSVFQDQRWKEMKKVD
jgi:hypothetical protein